MGQKPDWCGIAATTHIDKHGEHFTKEALEQMAQDRSDASGLLYWNHETTLPPIGVVTSQWVEKREDGEYQLMFEACLFDGESFEPLLYSNIKGLDVTEEQIREIVFSTPPSSKGHLHINYDPRNFEPQEIAPILDEIGELVDVEQGHYVRKAELPQPVIWVLVAYVAGSIVTGFFSRIGEVAADKVGELAKKFYSQLGDQFSRLLGKSKPEGSRPDIIFGLPIEGSDTVVEGALENADPTYLEWALGSLPNLYGLARHLLDRNPPGFFSIMRFLFNPESRRWEINYLVTRKSNKIIQGLRYYDPEHPLRHRYGAMLRKVSELHDRDSSNED